MLESTKSVKPCLPGSSCAFCFPPTAPTIVPLADGSQTYRGSHVYFSRNKEKDMLEGLLGLHLPENYADLALEVQMIYATSPAAAALVAFLALKHTNVNQFQTFYAPVNVLVSFDTAQKQLDQANVSGPQ